VIEVETERDINMGREKENTLERDSVHVLER